MAAMLGRRKEQRRPRTTHSDLLDIKRKILSTNRDRNCGFPSKLL
jgi:hypothetical protein